MIDGKNLGFFASVMSAHLGGNQKARTMRTVTILRQPIKNSEHNALIWLSALMYATFDLKLSALEVFSPSKKIQDDESRLQSLGRFGMRILCVASEMATAIAAWRCSR